MTDKVNRKNIKVIILQLVIVVLGILGTTFAVSYFLNTVNISLNTAALGVEYSGSLTLPTVDLYPIDDLDVSTNTENVMRVNFTIKGASANPTGIDIIYDVSLSNLVLDRELKSAYLKWELEKNSVVISSGSLSPDFDRIKDGRLVLTSTQQDLVAYNGTADDYEFRLWMSESCSTVITSCDLEDDQSNLLNKSIVGQVDIELYTKSKTSLVREPSLDTSGLNKPNLADGMIPIYYDTNTDVWKKADVTNTSNSWYDYTNKKWANAVMVTSATRGIYMSASVGTTITETDILAYYVWIPRFRYKLFNTTAAAISPEEIQIEFESEASTKLAGTADDEWLTHPAFTLGTEELLGMWIGKFEASGDVTAPTIKPNVSSVRSQIISVQYAAAQELASTTYLTITGVSEIDAHMMKNLEWGAVVYLTQSQYGRCTSGTCNEVCINNSTGYYTGRSGGAKPGSAPGVTYGTYTYNDFIMSNEVITGTKSAGSGTCASTTGNVYGIYDMSGGAYDIVMANLNDTIANSGFSTMPNSKYYDQYTGEVITSDFKLGDAMGETRNWYGDSATLPNSASPWLGRGGYSVDSTTRGIFNSARSAGGTSSAGSWRSVLSC